MEEPRAQDLAESLDRMTVGREPGRFGLVGLPRPAADAGDALALLRSSEAPWQVTLEGGELSLLVSWEAAGGISRQEAGARLDGPFAWLRFEAPMGWEVVGFLAHVTGALARAGIPLGAVCGSSRDHLFVPESRVQDALAALAGAGIPSR